jgi:hypothetical protein
MCYTKGRFNENFIELQGVSKMKWQAIRNKYPDTWVLFEALKAHSENGNRIVEDLAVLETFNDSNQALKEYRNFHHKQPQRELYVAHTQKINLDIHERKWLGIRA